MAVFRNRCYIKNPREIDIGRWNKLFRSHEVSREICLRLDYLHNIDNTRNVYIISRIILSLITRRECSFANDGIAAIVDYVDRYVGALGIACTNERKRHAKKRKRKKKTSVTLIRWRHVQFGEHCRGCMCHVQRARFSRSCAASAVARMTSVIWHHSVQHEIVTWTLHLRARRRAREDDLCLDRGGDKERV